MPNRSVPACPEATAAEGNEDLATVKSRKAVIRLSKDNRGISVWETPSLIYRVDYVVAMILAGMIAGVLLSRRMSRIAPFRFGRGYFLVIAVRLGVGAVLTVCSIVLVNTFVWDKTNAAVGDASNFTSRCHFRNSAAPRGSQGAPVRPGRLFHSLHSTGFGFVMSGYLKGFYMQGMGQFFTESGYPIAFLKFIMTAEMLGGIGLLIPSTVLPATAGLSIDMFGAIYTHAHNGDSINDSASLGVIAALWAWRPRRDERVDSTRRRFSAVMIGAVLCALAAVGGATLMRSRTVHAAALPPATSNATVLGKPDIRHRAPSRTYHVENYKLGLRFDEPKGEVFGDEAVVVKPFEPGFRKFYLNSAGLKIDAVSLEPTQGAAVKLAFSTTDSRLWITLDRDYDPTNTLRVRIVYHGVPRTGLFFVNPTKDYPDWPREVYSQGEPEFNHYWFPCWDYPNDMATSETITTVPEGQSVVSNGKLVKVTREGNNKTYDWVESVPHSSYLISIVVGPWRKVTDHYESKPVDYYVPRSVSEATARRSFHLTPDMIGFFSRATGLDYPYEKYAQTTVHNYIFGGQENVSATTLTDSTLHDARADADYPSTALVAHELGQHWFGDYVQGRDWANIWLNEGFATYLEALYTQHHEGNDAFRFEIYQDQLTEQQEERDNPRPIVDWQYGDPLDMFDAITHEKGAAVLDMLRYVVDGPEAAAQQASQKEVLFRALHHYLIANREQTADTPALIAAIREDTGLELDWFFHEWAYMVGNPEYHVEADYIAARQIERVIVTQTQHVDAMTPIFDMPIELAFYGSDGERKMVRVRDNLQRQEFDVPLGFVPQWADFDPDDFIDKIVQFEKPAKALIAEAEKDPSMMSRLWAVQQLGKAQAKTGTDARIEALKRALNADDFYGVRAAAATSLGELGTEEAIPVLLSALTQNDSRVRTAVVEALADSATKPAVYQALVNMLHDDSSYAVEAAAAEAIGKSRVSGSFEVLRAEVAAKPEVHMMEGTLAGLAETKDPRAVGILLAQSQTGVSERIRLSALSGLAELKDILEPSYAQQLAATVRAALDDPFLPMRMTAEQLAGEFAMTKFRSEIQKDADAPLVMQRELAQKVIKQLDHSKK